jgi:hypothetical protein
VSESNVIFAKVFVASTVHGAADSSKMYLRREERRRRTFFLLEKNADSFLQTLSTPQLDLGAYFTNFARATMESDRRDVG